MSQIPHQPPLDIEDYWIESLELRALDTYDSDQPLVGSVAFGLRYVRVDEPDMWTLHMQLKVNTPPSVPEADDDLNAPYYVNLVIAAQFRFAAQIPDDMKHRMLVTNAPAMLYGVARGLLGQATSSARHGRMVLPSMNFVELAKSAFDRDRLRTTPHERSTELKEPKATKRASRRRPTSR